MSTQAYVGMFIQEAFGSFALLMMVFPFNSFLGNTWSAWIQHFFSVMIVDKRVLKMIEDARRLRVPVTGDVISSVGRTVKKQLLASPEGISEVDKNKLEDFMASPKWKDNSVKRNGLVSKTLHGEAGGVDHEAAREGMDAIREAALNFDLEHILNVDEIGLFHEVLPRQTYLSEFEGRRTARGSKDMDKKDRVSSFVCTNATGPVKVPMSIIGKAQNPRCFKAHGAPIKFFSQRKAWSDTRVFRRWWDELFLPFVRSFTKKRVLLLMDSCSSHVSLKDPHQKVHVMVFPPNCTSVYQPCDQGIIVSTKRHYRRRLLDIRADQFCDAADLREDARRRKLKQGTRDLKNGHQPHVLDACELLNEAWDAVTPDTIARCWAVANTLPPIYQEELDKRRKKRKNRDDHEEGIGHSMESLEETTDRQSVEGVINKLSKAMQEATEEKRARFPDLRRMLDDLGVQNGDNATTAAVDAAVDWLDLEGQQGISDAVERDRQDIAIEHIHETAGDGTYDGEDDGDHEENERDCGSPEELQRSLDCIDEFATLTDNLLVSHHVREIREEVARTFHVGKEAENGETSDYLNGGAQVNPAVSVGTYFYGWNNVPSMVVRIVGQMAGGTFAFPIMAEILPSYALESMGGPVLAKDATVGLGMAWEFGSTLVLVLVVYVAATQIGLPAQRPVIATGIRALIHLSAVQGGKTGPSMNPMISTAWYVYDKSVTMDQAFVLVYWVAPIAGAVAGTVIWKFLEPKPKAKTD